MTSMLFRQVSGAILAIAVGLGVPLAVAAEQVSVTFLLANDLDTIDSDEERGGFARLAALVAHERETSENVILVNAGDAISPSLLSSFDRGSHIIELLNETPPDVFVPGNHEFDFGPEVFLQRMGEARFPVLAANLRQSDGKRVPGIGSSRMFEFDGVRIGIVGITDEDVYAKSSPGDLVIGAHVDALKGEAAALREKGADVVVAVAHAKRSADMEIVRSRAADLVLSGDDHDMTVFFDGITALAESHSQAALVAVVDLLIDVDEGEGGRKVSWWPRFRIVDTADFEPDPDIQRRLDRYNRELSDMLDLELGVTDIELDSRRATVRNGEAAIGNLIADALRVGTGADVAIVNGGGIRGDRVYPAGTRLARRDILTELPFGNRTVVVELTGAQLRQALENGVSDIENAAGRFPQVSGMRFEADISRPPGQRIAAVTVGSQPLNDAEVYVVAANDYMLNGGDGYDVLAEGRVIVPPNEGKLMTSEVIAYFQAHGTGPSKPEGRITIR
ncbi:bifunctional UDP-sugar hydrolase/5'-nucleotidase [Microbaculum marinum]|uniref:Bifunctional UDP-sugar hydrolase/5'-nucleotidase n=1 Tax=Microbaculum marinum TaxID=1764581 RepID=A0AAW9RNE8_9HYPH